MSFASSACIKFQSTLLMRGATRPSHPQSAALSHFNPRSSCEERPTRSSEGSGSHIFQSTLLMRGATMARFQTMHHSQIFQSTLLMRGATISSDKLMNPYLLFQSTLLMRGATGFDALNASSNPLFQSTLLMRGATERNLYDLAHGHFNPRSSCEERRGADAGRIPQARHFNPRSSCEERRAAMRTPPARPSYFNPRSSCEERPMVRSLNSARVISIHAPHARSDDILTYGDIIPVSFQSTLLMRGATLPASGRRGRCLISIHAPHARSDPADNHYELTDEQFQSTLLMRGATFIPAYSFSPSSAFQSTLLMRGATATQSTRASCRAHFNPRSSCEERPFAGSRSTCSGHFNPRSSCEERPALILDLRCCAHISIHAPHARSDEKNMPTQRAMDIFQSTLLMRGATLIGLAESSHLHTFQSTLLMRGATLHPRYLFHSPIFQSTLLMRGATIFLSIAATTAT